MDSSGTGTESATTPENGTRRLAVPFLVVAAAIVVMFVSIGFIDVEAPLEGSWELVEINGKPVSLDPWGTRPWVEFDRGAMSGYNGENAFGGRYSTSGSTMHTHEVFSELADCVGCPHSDYNAASVGGFFRSDEGFEFRIRGDRLTWSQPGMELEFVAVDNRRE